MPKNRPMDFTMGRTVSGSENKFTVVSLPISAYATTTVGTKLVLTPRLIGALTLYGNGRIAKIEQLLVTLAIASVWDHKMPMVTFATRNQVTNDSGNLAEVKRDNFGPSGNLAKSSIPRRQHETRLSIMGLPLRWGIIPSLSKFQATVYALWDFPTFGNLANVEKQTLTFPDIPDHHHVWIPVQCQSLDGNCKAKVDGNSLESPSRHSRELPYTFSYAILGNFSDSGNLAKNIKVDTYTIAHVGVINFLLAHVGPQKNVIGDDNFGFAFTIHPKLSVLQNAVDSTYGDHLQKHPHHVVRMLLMQFADSGNLAELVSDELGASSDLAIMNAVGKNLPTQYKNTSVDRDDTGTDLKNGICAKIQVPGRCPAFPFSEILDMITTFSRIGKSCNGLVPPCHRVGGTNLVPPATFDRGTNFVDSGNLMVVENLPPPLREKFSVKVSEQATFPTFGDLANGIIGESKAGKVTDNQLSVAIPRMGLPIMIITFSRIGKTYDDVGQGRFGIVGQMATWPRISRVALLTIYTHNSFSMGVNSVKTSKLRFDGIRGIGKAGEVGNSKAGKMGNTQAIPISALSTIPTLDITKGLPTIPRVGLPRIMDTPTIGIMRHFGILSHNSKAGVSHNSCQNSGHLNVAGETPRHLGGNNNGKNCGGYSARLPESLNPDHGIANRIGQQSIPDHPWQLRDGQHFCINNSYDVYTYFVTLLALWGLQNPSNVSYDVLTDNESPHDWNCESRRGFINNSKARVIHNFLWHHVVPQKLHRIATMSASKVTHEVTDYGLAVPANRGSNE